MFEPVQRRLRNSRSFRAGGAKSIEQAFEIQSQYAKKAYEAYVTEASKLAEMYVALARSAYEPIEHAVAKGCLSRSNSRSSLRPAVTPRAFFVRRRLILGTRP
jgi:Phasin protein